MKIKIGWLVSDIDWAYKNIMEHFEKEMQEYEHISNSIDADIVMAMSLKELRQVKDKKKTILHLDSKRALGL
ncbi:MAG: hypothetical protein BWX89_01130 [candidate division TA06 bacterium ADurb.Bin131]|jgi:hypothetical protein|uniref:Uncharacterized protein n=1 Tax=candidate division TA06 bacterium ADurb.Bin131 TaxID=1852827 RepID=A0A1V6C844_UNCT6|nr:MAG: hypothetical protein BWX89_01130 [candidate division TA06 bacterium ADurb.Bin131]